jgi:hypothetical protein
MNIFLLDFHARRAAQAHCDKHVVKMILETAQLLFTAHWVLAPEGLPPSAYKKTHAHHPCSVWVRQSLDNYAWLCELGLELCAEFTFRYGKTHKTQAHLEWLTVHPPAGLAAKGITTLPQAMPDPYKHPNAVTAYRTYYRENKLKVRGIVHYTRRSPPEFLYISTNDRSHGLEYD